MPSPVEELRHEHALTRRALELLGSMAQHVEEGGAFPADDVAVLLRFFHEFVEGVHHAKESEHLYPAVALQGELEGAETVGVLFSDHDDSRALLHSLMMFWEPIDDLVEAERQGFVHTARTYAQRMLRHMEMEEDVLFRLAETIPPDDRLHFADAFAELDRRRGGATTWAPEIDSLSLRWGDSDPQSH